jgi:hypothetical protein
MLRRVAQHKDRHPSPRPDVHRNQKSGLRQQMTAASSSHPIASYLYQVGQVPDLPFSNHDGI